MYYKLYTVLGWLLVIAAMPFFVPFCLLTRKNLASLTQRFGFFNPRDTWKHKNRLWFHAASVGEVQAAKALISPLIQSGVQADIIITTNTEQGHLTAIRQFGDTALCLYAPVDLPWVVERFIQKLNPSMYICLETELWPNILRLTRAHGVKTLLLNGRLSANSFRKYQKIVGFMVQVLGCFDSASVIQTIDRDRYLALGFDPAKIKVNGNAKYDLRIESLLAPHESNPRLSGLALKETVAQHYREMLGLRHNQPVLLAGSTHAGEEAIMLAALDALAATIPNLVLMIAPRHLDRLEQIKTAWLSKKVPFQTFRHAAENQLPSRVILVDRMGELVKLYALATYVFCGGSLVARGGHNIMEPASWGTPPFYGPHMNDFSDACTLLESQDAGYPIDNVQELVDKIRYFHQHQDKYQQASRRALAVASSQHGAATKQVEMITQLLGCSSTCTN